MWENCHGSWKVSRDSTCKGNRVWAWFNWCNYISILNIVYYLSSVKCLFPWCFYNMVMCFVGFFIPSKYYLHVVKGRFKNSLKSLVNWSMMLPDRTFYFCKRGGQVLPGRKAPWSPGCFDHNVTEGGHMRDMQIRIFIFGHIINTTLLYSTMFYTLVYYTS